MAPRWSRTTLRWSYTTPPSPQGGHATPRWSHATPDGARRQFHTLELPTLGPGGHAEQQGHDLPSLDEVMAEFGLTEPIAVPDTDAEAEWREFLRAILT